MLVCVHVGVCACMHACVHLKAVNETCVNGFYMALSVDIVDEHGFSNKSLLVYLPQEEAFQGFYILFNLDRAIN